MSSFTKESTPVTSGVSLNAAIASATLNIVLKICLRVTTFLINAFVLRFVTRDVLGLINVRLNLLYSTTVFLSFESFRRACLTRRSDWRRVLNLVWLSVPASALTGFTFCLLWSRSLSAPEEHESISYVEAVWFYGLVVVVESLAQPFIVTAQAYEFVRTKVFIEGVSKLTCGIYFAGAVFQDPGQPVLHACIAHLLQSIVSVVAYIATFAVILSKNKSQHDVPLESWKDFAPHWEAEPFLDPAQCSLVLSFFRQGILKQLLTEGERYMMTVFALLTFAEQGVFDVVNNLGSLSARLIFQPIEEAAYSYFALTIQREKPFKEHDPETIASLSLTLGTLLRSLSVLGLTILAFGLPYSHLLLSIYGGNILTAADTRGPILMQCHCFYVLLLAINGVSESFTFAAMSKKEVDRFNLKLLGLSGVFMTASLFLVHILGSPGFILANCVNMLLRIIHSFWFIGLRLDGGVHWQPFRHAMVGWKTLIVFLVAFLISSSSEVWVYPWSRALHFGIGALTFAISGGVVLYLERSVLRLRSLLEKKKEN
ncbi:unnamed protein product [Cyprideis torosa]|uniref:Protein RFT1 homolog n=1 Tax=Cyprideis torosa TaxID=163714 RepID=A0A7R8ZRE2_9CRUS|nr:unnamed protein product [Cyprideis torosa]CAG0894040.1 unnamed protein product [Cyprideis torosa]